MKDLTFKELIQRWRKQCDQDIGKFYDVHPLASNYHRGARDILDDVLEEMELRGIN